MQVKGGGRKGESAKRGKREREKKTTRRRKKKKKKKKKKKNREGKKTKTKKSRNRTDDAADCLHQPVALRERVPDVSAHGQRERGVARDAH